MNNRDFKIKVFEALKRRHIYTQQTSNIQIRTRCPYCGDSSKNSQTGHLYIRINPNDNLPIVYNCFKCPAQGVLKYEDLELLGITGNDFMNGLSTLNKTSDRISSSSMNREETYFEYELPECNNSQKVKYMENRLGITFSEEDLKNMKVITSLKDFLILNKINYVTCKPNIARMIEENYIGYLSNNNGYILFRDITDKSDIRWLKYPITEESRNSGVKIFYSIKTSIDLYTKEKIVINISEGVYDAVSICYNLNYNSENTLNIAVCGKYYDGMIKYLISKGFVGSNIIINVFADDDKTYDTSIKYLHSKLKLYSYLVGEINIYHNLLDKDYGVQKDKIVLDKHRV